MEFPPLVVKPCPLDPEYYLVLDSADVAKDGHVCTVYGPRGHSAHFAVATSVGRLYEQPTDGRVPGSILVPAPVVAWLDSLTIEVLDYVYATDTAAGEK